MSDPSIVVALLGLIGSALGTFGGILVANKLLTYRVEQLEKKVNVHNNYIERVYVLEGQMREAQHDIRDIKSKTTQGG